VKSLANRLANLEKALEQATAGETIIPVRLLVVENRQQAEALARFHEQHLDEEPPRQHPPGRIVLRRVPSIDARSWLAERGVVLDPAESSETTVDTTKGETSNDT
jgi:hypothetical protein